MPESFVSQLVNLLIPVVQLVVVAVVGLLAKRASEWINAKVNNEKARDGLNLLMRLTADVVLDLQQTMADPIKKAAEDGKLTPAERLELKVTAVNRIRDLAGPKQLEQLRKVTGLDDDGIKQLISTLVESAVYRFKVGEVGE